MTTLTGIGALILAAGYSSRMESFKPLLRMGNSTVLEEAVARFKKAGIEALRVVVGYNAGLITPTLDRLGVQWVLNEQFDKGMLSSVLAGVRSLGREIDAFFLLPVDVPLVKPKTIEALTKAHHRGKSEIIYPCFRGTRGHPPLIATACIPEDLAYDYPGGLRAFLLQYGHLAQDLEMADEAILMDCDTPADYEKMQAYARREDIPTERECEALWVQFGTPEKVINHSRMVAQVARLLAVHLNLAGLDLNLDLIVAAGCLHDLAKDRPNHAREAGRLLAELGYVRVAEIVASHMDICFRKGVVTEADLVYLADKCVAGDRLAQLEDRFQGAMAKYAGSSEISGAVKNRLNNARLIQGAVEKVLRQPLEEIIQNFRRNIEAVSNRGERLIYLIRHGAMQAPGPGKRFIGQVDLPLSHEGIEQIQRLKDELRSAQLSAIFCSDLKRSLETAALLSEMQDRFAPAPRPELREISLGHWDGLTFEEVRARYPDEFEERGRDMVHYRPPGGESFLDCTKRVIPAFFDILHATRGNILIVGHAGVNRIILCQVSGLSLDRLFDMDQDYGCLNVIHNSGGIFTLKTLNGKAV